LGLAIHRVVGDAHVPNNTRLLAVGSVLTGYVQLSENEPDRLLKVAFRASEQNFVLGDEDRVVVRDGKGYHAMIGHDVHSYYDARRVELMAVVRGGEATMLQGRNTWREPIDWPLATVLEHVLDDTATY
jgi:hypothetical protein